MIVAYCVPNSLVDFFHRCELRIVAFRIERNYAGEISEAIASNCSFCSVTISSTASMSHFLDTGKRWSHCNL